MQSFEDILSNLEIKKQEYNKLCSLLSYEEILLDKNIFLNIEKQKNLIKPIVEKYEDYLVIINSVNELREVINGVVEQEKLMFEKELKIEEEKLKITQEELEKMFARMEAQEEKVMVEIIKNKDELSAKLFEILINGYTNFCKQNNFNFNLDLQNSSAIFNISGFNAKTFFEEEIGLHSAKNTSLEGSCQVFVYNNINIPTYSFNEKEIQITACKSSGAGGQHINTTDSSIKIVHLPTNISAVSQDERSQFQNKQKALDRLKEKVEKYLQKQKNEQIQKQKKEQLIKIKNVVKFYDLDNEIIVKNAKQILLKDFLNGKILN